MISELPSPDDFFRHGTEALNVAFDIAIRLQLDCRGENPEGYLDIEHNDYWISAQPQLRTAMLLVQLGAELLLKSEIAKISPFLLIESPYEQWKSKKFSEFKTIDSRHLVRVLSSVRRKPVSSEFELALCQWRKQRNSIAHSGDANLVIDSSKVLQAIVHIAKELTEDGWLPIRRRYVQGSPVSYLGCDDLENWTSRELKMLLVLLPPGDCKEFLLIDKGRRWYDCPQCKCSMTGETMKMAQINPDCNTMLVCYGCGQSTTVTRKKCTNDDCKSDVIADTGCCICGHLEDT